MESQLKAFKVFAQDNNGIEKFLYDDSGASY